MRKLVLAAIHFYQVGLSTSWLGCCRHTPTCSHYAHEAISRYGVARGVWLAVSRLGRCRPFGTRGYDPVP